MKKLLRHKKSLAIIALALVNLGLLSYTLFYTFRWNFYPHPTAIQQAILNFKNPAPPQVKTLSAPFVQGQSYIIIDTETNAILSSRNPHLRIYPASTTKLATALTALNIYPLDELITIHQAYKEGKVMGLVPDEKITIKSLVSALLIFSANDAAFNLASYHLGGVEGFVKEMNGIATKYNLTDTHFVNFDGNHDPNHYSSVYDLSQLARLAIKSPIVRDTVKLKELIVTDISGEISHPLITTNELLGVVPEVEGLKTGWTPEAGGCFVGLLNINGHYVISVVAQSPDRFADTRSIVSWLKTNVEW